MFKSPQPSARAIVETAKGNNPSGGNRKRAASTSPVLPANKETKKKKAKENGWTKVEPKRKKSGSAPVQNEIKEQATIAKSVKGLRKKTKPNAILIKPSQGLTYADVIVTVRNSVDPEESSVVVWSVRRTRAGEVLLELQKTTADVRESFSDALTRAVGNGGSVNQLVPKSTLEIWDLDCCTTKEEEEEALRRELPT